jgi:uncharacterized protein
MCEKIKYIVLWLTNDCNLNCKYCYADAGKKKEYMTFDTAIKALKLADSKYTLQLAGGEPLMNMSLIQDISKYLQETGQNTKIQIQTNGLLLTEENVLLLKKMNASLGVSLDGVSEVNEDLRGNTADVIAGIKMLGQHGMMTNINCVITQKSINRLTDLIDLSFYLGNIGGIGLDLLREAGRGKRSDLKKASPAEIEDNLVKAYERTKELYKLTGKKIAIREIEEARRRMKYNIEASDYCYAAKGSAMAVLPDGNLYPCGSLVGNKKYYMGNINDKSKINMISLEMIQSDMCMKCKYKQLCVGACPARSIVNGGIANFTKEDCALKKTAFKIVEKEIENVRTKKCNKEIR